MPTELWMAAERALDVRNKDLRCYRIGCVILRSDGVLVSSRNGSSTHKMPQAHAEARCAKKADKHSVAYVARVRRDGSIGCARPCKLCRIQLRSHGVIDAFYTIGPNQWGRMCLHDESEYVWKETIEPMWSDEPFC